MNSNHYIKYKNFSKDKTGVKADLAELGVVPNVDYATLVLEVRRKERILKEQLF